MALSRKEIKAKAKAYLDTPKAERRAAGTFHKILEKEPEVAHEIRKVLEGRRGYRRVNGRMEFTPAALRDQIERKREKLASLDDRKKILQAQIEDHEDELAELEESAEESAETSAPAKKKGGRAKRN